MKKTVTFTANIYLGLKHGYSGDAQSSIDDVRQWLQKFCNKVKIGVTLTPTEFVYVDGSEPGVIVGLIQYPRFPRSVEYIRSYAMDIAKGLMDLCHQERVSIVCPDETVMLERDKNDNQVL
jgi:hypothetical protein